MEQEQPPADSFSGGAPAPGGGNPFAEALKRAKEMAAGMQQMRNDGGAGEDGEPNLKRPYEDSGLVDQPAKKPMIESAGGGNPSSIDFAQATAQAQAKISQFLAQAPVPVANTEEMTVPNRMVGVIIGRGGDTINRLQNDSGARIQCAPADAGNPSAGERTVTLTGSPEAIQNAKVMIQALVDQGPPDQQAPPNVGAGLMGQPNMGGGMPPMGGGGMPGMGGPPPPMGEVFEQLIPQPKVGLVIGKGGETIKRLQEQAGCRMQMIQDGQYMNGPQKLLRIQGNPSAIEAAKNLVNELIGGSDFIAPGNHTLEMQVPSNLVGMVIGRGGESIKRIQAETAVRIQFQQDQQHMARPGMRTATLIGPPEGLPQAQKMVVEILERGAEGSQGGGGGRPPMMGMGGQQVEFPVPASRCGLVIGKGGETIRNLQAQCGAHIQLNRNAQCGPDEKVFTIRGSREQVAHAQELIREKCDMPHSGPSYGQGMQPGGMAAPGMYGGQGQGMGQQPYAAYPMQQQQQGYPQAGGAMGGDVQAQQAAWAAYYHQYYSQMAAAAAANPAAMGQGGQPGAPGGVQQGAQAAAPQGGPQAATSAAGGQDLQAQWAEYYRQLGYAYPTAGQQGPTS